MPSETLRGRDATDETASTTALKRDVGVDLDVDITDATTLEFQIAVAPQPGPRSHRVAVLHVRRQPHPAHEDQR